MYVCVCARAYIHIRTRTHAHTQVVLVGGRAGLECFKEVFIRRKEWNDRGMDVFRARGLDVFRARGLERENGVSAQGHAAFRWL